MNSNASLAPFKQWSQWPKWLSICLVLAAVFLLSCLEFRLLQIIHIGHMDSIHFRHMTIVEGNPMWNIVQSRVLGPYLIWLIAENTPLTTLQSDLAVQGLLVMVKNFLMFVCIWHWLKCIKTALLATFAGASSFIALQHMEFLLVWDFLDVIFFTAFCYGAVHQRHWLFFIGLFSLAIWNRESALFIALWVFLSGFRVINLADNWQAWFRIRIRIQSWFNIASGIVMLIAGIALVKYLRVVLPVGESVASDPANLPDNYVIYLDTIHITLLQNLVDVTINNLTTQTGYLNILMSVLAVASAAILWWYRRIFATHLPWVLTYFAIYVALWGLAILNNPRVYMIFIPFWVFMYLLHTRQPRSQPAAAFPS